MKLIIRFQLKSTRCIPRCNLLTHLFHINDRPNHQAFQNPMNEKERECKSENRDRRQNGVNPNTPKARVPVRHLDADNAIRFFGLGNI